VKEADFDWENTYFADEKWWALDGPANREGLWVGKHEPRPILSRMGRHQAFLRVWGCFSANGALDLVRVDEPWCAKTYCSVLEKSGLPRGSVLLHDRDTSHQAYAVKAFFKRRSVKIDAHLFPPCAADINPIENLWGIVTNRIFTGVCVFSCKEKLWEAVKEAWAGVQADNALLRRMAQSVPTRLALVQKAKGGLVMY
jgi:hypothetical protein